MLEAPTTSLLLAEYLLHDNKNQRHRRNGNNDDKPELQDWVFQHLHLLLFLPSAHAGVVCLLRSGKRVANAQNATACEMNPLSLVS